MSHQGPMDHAGAADQGQPLIIVFQGITRNLPQTQPLVEGLQTYCRELQLAWQVLPCDSENLWRGISISQGHQGPLVLCGLLREGDIQRWRKQGGRQPDYLISSSAFATQPPIIQVLPDERSIGEQALAHLLRCGYRHFATWGSWDQTSRHAGFVAAFLQAQQHDPGLSLHAITNQAGGVSAVADETALAEQLRSLPQPLALFAHQDQVAAHIRSLCRFHGLRVPTDYGILGVDDDVQRCTAESPELSSVRIPWRLLGQRQGILIHRLLSGDRSLPQRHTVPAYGVSARRSTAIHEEVTDPLVRACLRQIQDGGHQCSFSVAESARRLGVSRATLHRRVVATTGRSPQEHLQDARVDRACRRLRGTRASLSDIATACGYACRQQLHSAFVARMGVPPGIWRNG